MPLNKSELSKLIEMQSLCASVEEDAEAIRRFGAFVKESSKRYARLRKLYEDDWVRLSESPKLSAAQRAQVEARVPEGRYSIFWQDVIWNALSDVYEESKKLRKELQEQRN